MPRTRLFISHSSKTDAARTRLEAIRQSLEEAGYHPLVDKRFIKTSDEWRERIHRMLALCHGGVILFDDDALASPWVLKEATILTWRRELEKKFQLVPLWLGDDDPDAFGEAPWHPLHLGEVQYAQAEGKVAERVAEAEVPTETEAPTPYDELMGALADKIEGAVGTNELQLAAGNLLEPDDDEVLLGDSWEKKVADLLARRIFRGKPPAEPGAPPKPLEDAIDLLREVSKAWPDDTRKEIVQLLRPLWVESQAGAMVGAALRRDQGFRDIALCCHPSLFQPLVARRHIDRACGVGAERRVWPVEDASAGDDAAHVRQSLRGWFREEAKLRALTCETDQDLDAAVAEYAKPFFVLLPSIADPTTLESLRGTYDNATFLMHSEVRGEGKPALPKRVRYVAPELTLEEEIAAASGEDAANKFIRGEEAQ